VAYAEFGGAALSAHWRQPSVAPASITRAKSNLRSRDMNAEIHRRVGHWGGGGLMSYVDLDARMSYGFTPIAG
jgi:hypothetical protein